MQVIKRNGNSEPVSFDKITSRISKLAYGLNPQFVDPTFISQKWIKGVYDGVTTADLDNLAAETAVGALEPVRVRRCAREGAAGTGTRARESLLELLRAGERA